MNDIKKILLVAFVCSLCICKANSSICINSSNLITNFIFTDQNNGIPDSLKNVLYNDEIINFLEKQRLTHTWENDIKIIDRILDTINYDKGQKELMFSYSMYDSVVVYNTNCKLLNLNVQPCEYGSAFNIETREMKEKYPGKRISSNIVDSVLKYVNNPMNHIWGNCGCYESTSVFAFYLNNKIVAIIEFICDYGDTFFWPNNPRIFSGGIIEYKIIEYVKSEGVFFGN